MFELAPITIGCMPAVSVSFIARITARTDEGNVGLDDHLAADDRGLVT